MAITFRCECGNCNLLISPLHYNILRSHVFETFPQLSDDYLEKREKYSIIFVDHLKDGQNVIKASGNLVLTKL